MRTVSIFRNNRNQAVRLPKDFEYPAEVAELVIEKHGDVITLRPVRPDWASFFDLPPLPEAENFLRERPPIFVERKVFPDEDAE
ncbi:MAG: AbrB/MazE/SpoVT family DNA-binding domain-containing protein [Hyphomicrobiales bacterium]|nr:AbrB/MazE/SpoVT family DNA-binding domain-containing protein [Hyphomicrobiales bacterium]